MKFYKLEDGSGRYLGMDDTIPKRLIELLPELIANGLVDTSHEKTYSQEEFERETSPPKVTWENTIACHGERSSSEELMNTGYQLGYDYFAWNGRVFKIINRNQSLGYNIVEDVYEIDIK